MLKAGRLPPSRLPNTAAAVFETMKPKHAKPTKAELAEVQAAVTLLWQRGFLSVEQNNRLQNKIDNEKSGKGRGKWGMRWKGEE